MVSLFGTLYGRGLHESKLKVSIPVLMQVGMPWRLSIIKFVSTLSCCFVLRRSSSDLKFVNSTQEMKLIFLGPSGLFVD